MSEVKVNKISPRSGTEVTLGDSGDTFTIPSGVTISNSGTAAGFGSTGEVSWDTTVKTSTITGVAGVGYFANTTGGAFALNLPAGTAGSSIAVADYAGTFQTNALTITPNGSQKIGGIAASIDLSTEGQSAFFVYVDNTQGWINVIDSTSNVRGNDSIVATGGNTVTTCGNCKIHTFTGPGTFTVCSVSTSASNNVVSYMIVAGGAGSGAGGGGAGGFREFKSPVTPYTASPLVGATPITVTAQGYPVVVGGGSSGQTCNSAPSSNGSPSSIFGITSAGGGGSAGFGSVPAATGIPGGSGGGGTRNGGPRPGGTGNQPPVSPPQGQNGGAGYEGGTYGSGGGGGAGGVGSNAPSSAGGPGGGGVGTLINPSSSFGTPGPGPARYYAGGGAGGSRCASGPFPGGFGGGGNGSGNVAGYATVGTINTGGGGGGNENPGGVGGVSGKTGGSGIVIIRYKFQ